jgi:hypothetical protein
MVISFKLNNKGELIPEVGLEPTRSLQATDFLTTITFVTEYIKYILLWSGLCLLHTIYRNRLGGPCKVSTLVINI